MSDPAYHYRRKLERITEGCSTNQVIAMTMVCQQIAEMPLSRFDEPFKVEVNFQPISQEESDYGREQAPKPAGGSQGTDVQADLREGSNKD